MPKGIPVATVAIGGGENAGLLAAKILAGKYPGHSQRLIDFRAEQTRAAVASSPECSQQTHRDNMTGPILPGTMLGVLGGGQLGAMCNGGPATRLSRCRMGSRSGRAGPRACESVIQSTVCRLDALKQFGREVSAVTYEWENIPISVTEALEKSVPVRPGSAVLGVLQNRLNHNPFLPSMDFRSPLFDLSLIRTN